MKNGRQAGGWREGLMGDFKALRAGRKLSLMRACLAVYEKETFCSLDVKTLIQMDAYILNGRQACLAANEMDVFNFLGKNFEIDRLFFKKRQTG